VKGSYLTDWSVCFIEIDALHLFIALDDKPSFVSQGAIGVCLHLVYPFAADRFAAGILYWSEGVVL